MSAQAKQKAKVKAKNRRAAPRGYWKQRAVSLHVPSTYFRLVSISRGKRLLLEGYPLQRTGYTKPLFNATGTVENFDWVDSEPVLTGSIRLREPPFKGRMLDKVRAGDLIVCQASSSPYGPFRELWRMRCRSPSHAAKDDTYEYDLVSDLIRLRESYQDFKFVKDKRHPRGWRGDQILAYVCRQYGIALRCPRMRHTFRRLVWLAGDQERNVYDLVAHVLRVERNQHDRRYRLDMVGRTLRVSTFQRNRKLLALGGTIREAVLSHALHERFATEVTVVTTPETPTGKDKKGHRRVRKGKITQSVRSTIGQRRFGTVRRRVYSITANTPAQARAEGKKFLARVLRPDREFTVTHTGIPTVGRADSVRVGLPSRGIKANVYVLEARHSVSPGDYTMELTMTFDDPFVDSTADAILDKLSDTARERQRQPPKKAKKKAKKKPTQKDTKKQENRKTKRAGQDPKLGNIRAASTEGTATPVRGAR